ncbi:type 2 lanthipeptide synthetase LanM family protein [Actinomadura sp. NPDC047616]|uniref:type 2 lanthipeptide synthetase LanM family protein n=1 Tax=Actinomadura sp. NPDC047616 TaxID=3155914 RepID=UPI0033E87818
MDRTYPLDIAARAANLSERVQVVSVLGTADVADGGDDEPDERGRRPPPDAYGVWRLERLAGRLAVRRPDEEAAGRARSVRYTRQALVETLTAYRRHERDPGARAARVLRELHHAWLPTYEAALNGVHEAGPATSDASWRAYDDYYGRLATACEPFLAELARRLTGLRGAGIPVRPRVVDDFQRHLLERFEPALARAVETDARVHLDLHSGLDAGDAADNLAYLDKTFADAESYHRFYLDFPVLGRWLAHVTALLADHGRLLLTRLRADADALAETLFGGRRITAIRSVRPGLSGPHAGARSVTVVEVELGDARAHLVYKPRCVRAEAAYQGLLARLRDDGVLDFAVRPVLARDGYGYEALIPSGRATVPGQAGAERVHREFGGHLALFYVLGGELRPGTVLVADGHAHVADCSTVLGASSPEDTGTFGTLVDSVLGPALLDWPTTVDVLPGLLLDDAPVRTADHTDAIKDGFCRVHRWFEQWPGTAVECVTGLFTGSRVRVHDRDPREYADLLRSAGRPRSLMDPLEVDLLFDAVRDQAGEGPLPAWELASMWRLDVPLFAVAADDDRVTHDHRTPLGTRLAATPLDRAAARIRRLAPGDRARQARYIAAGLGAHGRLGGLAGFASGEVTDPDFAAAAVDHAVRIGERLCAMLREPDAPAPWTSYQRTRDGKVEVDVEGDLYLGTAGIALFLAYLNEESPQPRFREAARRALQHAAGQCGRRGVGAFTGTGGLVYALTHLYALWDDLALLNLAVRLSRDIADRIDRDRHLDVLGGAAGIIPVMLGLARATGGTAGLDVAHRCADHLLRQARADRGTLCWPRPDRPGAHPGLTGFAHGAGGIGWALIALGAGTDGAEYIEAGRRAFAYEARRFDEAARDGDDPRGRPRPGNAWCNGAAGTGLSRIHSWDLLGRDDESLLDEAHRAVSATMRDFPRLMNDSLCHGRCGNAELFLRYAELRDRPAFRLEADVQVQTQWQNPGPEGDGFFPGLMLGLSGHGMHFLRLAHPDRIPSVLLLDPPPGLT